MDKIFQRIVDNHFSELTGLAIDASIPVTESLANEFIATALRGNDEITYCQVRIGRENRITLIVKTPRSPWPFNLKLRLFRSVDFTQSPTVRAFLENNILLGKLGTLFKALPPGINIYGDQVSVDLAVFLNVPEHKQLIDLIKAVEISSEEGKIVFDVKIEK